MSKEAWNGESDRFVTKEEDTWVSQDGRKPLERWEEYIEIEYVADKSLSKDYLQGALDVINICKDMLHNDSDRIALSNLAQTMIKEMETME